MRGLPLELPRRAPTGSLSSMKAPLFAAAVLLLAACSSESPETTTAAQESKSRTPEPPSDEQMREMIAASAEFGQHEFTNAAVSLPVSGAAMNEPTRDTAKQLAAAGWLAFDGAGNITLTDKSSPDKRFLLRENGLLDIVPLAKKEMGMLTDAQNNPDGTIGIDFSWKWLPNEVGAAFTSGPIHERFNTTHPARATIMWNGTEWTMISIERR